MSKLAHRLLVFFVGLPLVLCLVFFNFFHYFVLNIAIIVFTGLAANELCNMMKHKGLTLYNKPLIIIFSVLLPVCAFNIILFNLSFDYLYWIYLFEILVLMTIECFSAKEFTQSVEKISFSSFIIFYTGFLMTFLSRLSSIPNNTSVFIILYLLMVFLCDSGAWLFGMLFGKSSRGIVKASPNKSLVGFIGGILSSIAIGILMKVIFPEIFVGNYFKIVILGFFTAISGIVGDLIESVFKRSCNIKDSGTLIPGRGGVLDSIDSLLIAAPIFYIIVQFLYLN